jgi:ribosome-binding protein aMBF1 (putative translation factor)
MRKLREAVEAEADDIRRRGREAFAAHEQALGSAIRELKQARESIGLSLEEVAQRMGTDRANVHRLENVPGNPTVATLARYANAVGKSIVISVANHPG